MSISFWQEGTQWQKESHRLGWRGKETEGNTGENANGLCHSVYPQTGAWLLHSVNQFPHLQSTSLELAISNAPLRTYLWLLCSAVHLQASHLPKGVCFRSAELPPRSSVTRGCAAEGKPLLGSRGLGSGLALGASLAILCVSLDFPTSFKRVRWNFRGRYVSYTEWEPFKLSKWNMSDSSSKS